MRYRMPYKSLLLIVLGLSLVGGCSEHGPANADEETDSEFPMSGYVEAVDKARDAEDQVLQAAEEQRRRIEAQEN